LDSDSIACRLPGQLAVSRGPPDWVHQIHSESRAYLRHRCLLL
jgi:hypothetical protein